MIYMNVTLNKVWFFKGKTLNLLNETKGNEWKFVKNAVRK